jgi:hypothetical protein
MLEEVIGKSVPYWSQCCAWARLPITDSVVLEMLLWHKSISVDMGESERLIGFVVTVAISG